KLWDWGRLGLDGTPRPIHLEHGLANIVWNRDTEWVGKNRPRHRASRRMHLRSLAALGSVVAATRARLRRGLQRSAVHHHRRGPWLASRELTQQRAQVLHHDPEAPGPYPTPRLLIHRWPRRQIVGHHPPVRPRLH